MAIRKKYAAVLLLMMVAACTATYFKVTDPATGTEYYTGDFEYKDGAVQFKDARTGATTTVKNPQVLEIDQRTFDSGVAAPSAPTSK